MEDSVTDEVRTFGLSRRPGLKYEVRADSVSLTRVFSPPFNDVEAMLREQAGEVVGEMASHCQRKDYLLLQLSSFAAANRLTRPSDACQP